MQELLFRGGNPAASLKHVQLQREEAETLYLFRGGNPAASLKL